MPARKIIFAFCLICFVSFGARAQQPPRAKPGSNASRAPQPVPPPPKPADDGPSLEDTMKFIQDKMNDIGTLKYTVRFPFTDIDGRVQDISYSSTQEVTNAIADPQGCTLSYHLNTFTTNGVADGKPIDGKPEKPENYDFVLNFREVKKITVTPIDHVLPPGTTVSPLSFEVTVFLKSNKGLLPNPYFYVDDEELGNRLARAINHAVELCTPDKKPEPF